MKTIINSIEVANSYKISIGDATTIKIHPKDRDRTDTMFIFHIYASRVSSNSNGNKIGEITLDAFRVPGAITLEGSIEDDFRNNGIMTQVANKMCEMCAGCNVWVYTELNNTACRRVAEKCGFTYTETKEGYYGGQCAYYVRTGDGYISYNDLWAISFGLARVSKDDAGAIFKGGVHYTYSFKRENFGYYCNYDIFVSGHKKKKTKVPLDSVGFFTKGGLIFSVDSNDLISTYVYGANDDKISTKLYVKFNLESQWCGIYKIHTDFGAVYEINWGGNKMCIKDGYTHKDTIKFAICHILHENRGQSFSVEFPKCDIKYWMAFANGLGGVVIAEDFTSITYKIDT